jgi:hypothetical protein
MPLTMKPIPTLLGSMVLAALAAPVFAALGGDAASVEADRARLKGTARITAQAGITVHEITTAAGTQVREYLGADGRVFALSWRGPAMPDLPQMLGSYSPQLHQASQAAHYNHHHLSLHAQDVVVESTAHLRSFYGRAWVPALLPQNFSVAAIN